MAMEPGRAYDGPPPWMEYAWMSATRAAKSEIASMIRAPPPVHTGKREQYKGTVPGGCIFYSEGSARFVGASICRDFTSLPLSLTSIGLNRQKA